MSHAHQTVRALERITFRRVAVNGDVFCTSGDFWAVRQWFYILFQLLLCCLALLLLSPDRSFAITRTLAAAEVRLGRHVT